MATLSSLTLSTPKISANSSNLPRPSQFLLFRPWARTTHFRPGRIFLARPIRAAPEDLSKKVEQSIKSAEEACAGDPVSGECVAAWDEVEELSAAASHAKAKKKDSDPLETYCADNPETDECRTYDN